MLDSIIDGIVEALKNNFGGVPVYTEHAMQGLLKPCFNVYFLESNSEQLLGSRYKRDYYFTVQYVPHDSKDNFNSVLDGLYYALEIINVDGDKVRAMELRGEFANGMIYFTVIYSVIIKYVEYIAKMKTIHISMA